MGRLKTYTHFGQALAAKARFQALAVGQSPAFAELNPAPVLDNTRQAPLAGFRTATSDRPSPLKSPTVANCPVAR